MNEFTDLNLKAHDTEHNMDSIDQLWLQLSKAEGGKNTTEENFQVSQKFKSYHISKRESLLVAAKRMSTNGVPETSRV